MAYSVSLLTLRTRARERIGYENCQHVTDTELTAIINGGIAVLYQAVLLAHGEEPYCSSSAVTTSSGTEAYNLPADFMQLLGVDWQISSTEYRKLLPYSFHERRQYPRGWLPLDVPRYRLRGSQIVFTPVPQGVHSLTLWYVPAPTKLSADGDTFDFVAGWDEFVIADACVKIATKEESDPSVYAAQRTEQLALIKAVAPMRDQAHAPRVVDVLKIGCDEVYHAF